MLGFLNLIKDPVNILHCVLFIKKGLEQNWLSFLVLLFVVVIVVVLLLIEHTTIDFLDGSLTDSRGTDLQQTRAHLRIYQDNIYRHS